ncbi:DUF2950 domain-containing protein [Roseomonas sp. HJA6]|uniref:DUF2950 domain-containing protein n=1 Tax=Roseomonas alba TaxID=2846776 RepID=A0ABS7AHF5_9PROT|nr:DUF2950 domain-containing protein [Neoroseomonas alba]MBW6401696.1 DUF2950 domain-containing protein [Neoroseomonas alba]
MIRTALRGALAALILTPVALAQAPVPGDPPAAEQPAPRRRAPSQQTFRTPEEGFSALVAALRAPGDRQALRVLGLGSMRLLRSGDPVADRAARDAFLAAFDRKSEIVRPSPGRAVLQVGEDGWPLPLVLVQRNGTWRFDTAAATQEIVDRRIGRNELDTIDTLRELVRVQEEYARGPGRQGALRVYAQRFMSTPGQHDGLYWPSEPGAPESPLGPLAAEASAEGYGHAAGSTAPQPFHGYLFRILAGQGPAARGGALDYVVNGRMIGGFAIVAWPARYGVSGIKTFMVSHDGMVWERDLGPDTAQAAAAITRFDPGEGWSRVAE